MSFRAIAYQRRLQDVGVDPKVAQTHAEAMEEFVVSELVTNDHLDAKAAQIDARFSQLEAKFDARFAELKAEVRTNKETLEARLVEFRAELRGEIKSLEATLIRWTVGTIGVAAGLIVAFSRLGN